MHKASKIAAAVAVSVVAAVGVVAFAQEQKPAARPSAQSHPQKPATPAAPAQAPAAAPANAAAASSNDNTLPSHWTSRCVSDARNTALDCAVEQSAVVTQTGQLIAAVTIRLPPDTHRPVIMIQLPVGLFLPAGVTVQVDEGKPQQIVLQTCDLKGCYAGSPLSEETIAAMKAGKRFAVSFQNAGKENITIPFGLSNFAEAYQHIQ